MSNVSDSRVQDRNVVTWNTTRFAGALFDQTNYKRDVDTDFFAVASQIVERYDYRCSICGLQTPSTSEWPLGLMHIYDPSNIYDVKSVTSYSCICTFCHASANIYGAIRSGRFTVVLQPKLSQAEINSICMIDIGLTGDQMGRSVKRAELFSLLYESTGNMLAIMPAHGGKKIDDGPIGKERRISLFIQNICLRYSSGDPMLAKVLESVRTLPIREEFVPEGKYLLKNIIPGIGKSFL